MLTTFNFLNANMQALIDKLFSTWAIVAYVAIVVVIVICIMIIAIRKDAKAPKIVHKVELPEDVSVKAEGTMVSGGGRKGAPQSASESAEDNGRSRFYMLSVIDANRARYKKTGFEESIRQ